MVEAINKELINCNNNEENIIQNRIKLISFSFPSKIIISGEHFVVYGSSLFSICHQKRKMEIEVFSVKNKAKDSDVRCNDSRFVIVSIDLSREKNDIDIDNKNEYISLNDPSDFDIIDQIDYSLLDNIMKKIIDIELNKDNEDNNNDIDNDKDILISSINNAFSVLVNKEVMGEYQNNIDLIKGSLLNLKEVKGMSSNKKSLLMVISYIFYLLDKVNYNHINTNIKIKSSHSLLRLFRSYISRNNFYSIIKSNIPQGNGLGSSAAYSSCISSVLIYLIKDMLTYEINNNNSKSNHNNKELFNLLTILNSEPSNSIITKLATLTSELFFHYKTTGGDIWSVYHKQALLFKSINDYTVYSITEEQNEIRNSNKNKAENNENSSNTIKSFFNKYNLFVIYTQMNRSASSLIKKVSKSITEEDIKNYNVVNNELIDLILHYNNKNNNNANNSNEYDIIKQKIGIIQRYLSENLGVSNEKLNSLISILTNEGFCGKITGAGGGGCIISIVESSEKERFKDICNKNNIEIEEVEI